jgi:hypothetical protein
MEIVNGVVQEASGSSAEVVLPTKYLVGLELANHTDADHDIEIAVGKCRDGADAYDMVLASALVKRIDAVFAAGTGNGGLFSGSPANSTWYHVHLIRKTSDGTIDAYFDTSVTAANIPSGYAAYRRIGSVLTDGSANIIGFVQKGDEFRWKTCIQEFSDNNPGVSAVTKTLSRTPTGVVVWADLFIRILDATPSGGTKIYLASLDLNDVDLGGTSFHLGATTSNVWPGSFVKMKVNTLAQFKYKFSQSTADHYIDCVNNGWTDPRGKY